MLNERGIREKEDTSMKVGIIGSGNMGSGLARRITLAGHDVIMTARDLKEAEKIGKAIGPLVKVWTS
jgi:predicted dinucleotide-binding enzyme